MLPCIHIDRVRSLLHHVQSRGISIHRRTRPSRHIEAKKQTHKTETTDKSWCVITIFVCDILVFSSFVIFLCYISCVNPVLLLDTSVIKKGFDFPAKGCPQLLQKWGIAVVIPCENGSTLVFLWGILGARLYFTRLHCV